MADLLETSGAVLGEPGGRCDVRVLGMEGDTSYAWAECQSRTAGAASVPVRVDGEDIQLPEDGSGYSDSVRGLFPPGLAKAISDREEHLRP